MATEVDEDDVWGAVATSPSASPPPVISTAHTGLQLLAASGGCGSPFLPGIGVGAAGDSGGPVERRKKRMKNLESATRSRVRKQAHVTQIETEVVELREVNEQLRLKYEQLKATAEVSTPVKTALHRVLSAPF